MPITAKQGRKRSLNTDHGCFERWQTLMDSMRQLEAFATNAYQLSLVMASIMV